MESLRDARFSEYLLVCFRTVVTNAPGMVPRDHSDLLKQSHFNSFNYSEGINKFSTYMQEADFISVKIQNLSCINVCSESRPFRWN